MISRFVNLFFLDVIERAASQAAVVTDIQPAVWWAQRSSSPSTAAPLPPLSACSVSLLSAEGAELFRWM